MEVDEAQAAEALDSPNFAGLDEDRQALLEDALSNSYGGHRMIATDENGNPVAAARWIDSSEDTPVEIDEEVPLEAEQPLPTIMRKQPKIVLESVASKPGSGAGTKLIAQIAAIADEKYVPIELESSRENHRYYKRLGFYFDKSSGNYVLTPIKARELAIREGIKKVDPSKDFVPLVDPGKSGNGHIKTWDGARLWGKYGAAGVMIKHTDDKGVERFLLVQRGPSVSSNRWKWQLPGGALDSNENDYQGAARELMEELEPPSGYMDKIKAQGEVTFKHPSGWHYTNIAAESPEMFAPHVDGTETNDGQWFTREEIADLPLQPAFRDSINDLMKQAGSPPVDLPETPVEPDLEYWEPKIDHEDTDWFSLLSDEAGDPFLDQSPEELAMELEHYRENMEHAKKVGDRMQEFLWSQRLQEVQDRIDATAPVPVQSPSEAADRLLAEDVSSEIKRWAEQIKTRIKDGKPTTNVADAYANLYSSWTKDESGPFPQYLVDAMNDWIVSQPLNDSSATGDPQKLVTTPDGRIFPVDAKMASILEDAWSAGIKTFHSDQGGSEMAPGVLRGGYISFPSAEERDAFIARYGLTPITEAEFKKISRAHDYTKLRPKTVVVDVEPSYGSDKTGVIRFDPRLLNQIKPLTASVRPDMMPKHVTGFPSSPGAATWTASEELEALEALGALLASFTDTITSNDTRRRQDISKRMSILGK